MGSRPNCNSGIASTTGAVPGGDCDRTCLVGPLSYPGCDGDIPCSIDVQRRCPYFETAKLLLAL
ncbi:hypothetical protein TIFTF001_015270 [Ficus carica]|uniref:Uncharacterized protein n=1 Tax=Ficus carica TaxID=3494 RepID=A0AA88A461_FICCA|nr:hypothetical protein TIFTF001_015270 [Ficus carica]